MPASEQNRPAALLAWLPFFAVAVTLLVAGLVLTGWLADIPALRVLIPGQVSMKANTALCFILTAIALAAAIRPGIPGMSVVRTLAAGSALVVAGLTAFQYASGADFGIDQFIARAPVEIQTSSRGRMSLITALAFVLLVAALVTDLNQTGTGRRVSRALAFAVIMLAVTSVVGYIYSVPQLYFGLSPGGTAMSLPTAVLFILLATGLVWVHPVGFPAFVMQRSITGAYLRIVIPMLIVAPLLVGAAVVSGYGELYRGPLAVALTVLGSLASSALITGISLYALRKEENARFINDRALAAATNGVAISDYRKADQPLVYVNDAFTAITGYTAREVLGRNCRFLQRDLPVPEDVRKGMRDCLRTVSEGRFELLNRRKNGEEFWNQLSLAPVMNDSGTVTHYVGILVDITQRKEQEIELKRALAAAEQAHILRDNFIRSVSHELRSPLNSALTWLRLMEVDRSDETLTTGMEVIGQSILTQSRLIDDLVDASRFASSDVNLEIQETDLTRLIQVTIDELRPSIPAETRVEVDLPEEELRGHVDPVRMQQVIRNLVSNAGKYTPPGGRIEIRAAREDDRLVLTVRDNGKGLTEEQRQKLFEPFWRADLSTPGLGIGLSIVARLVAAQGGTVTATSEGLDKGSAFTIRIPAFVDSPPKRISAPSL